MGGPEGLEPSYAAFTTLSLDRFGIGPQNTKGPRRRNAGGLILSTGGFAAGYYAMPCFAAGGTLTMVCSSRTS